MDRKTKETQGDSENSVFVIDGAASSDIHEISKIVGYFLRVGVTWEDLLIEFMGGCAVKYRMVHSWMVKKSNKVAYEVLDALEHCYRSGRSVYIETIDSINKVRIDIFNNMEKFVNLGTGLSKVSLPQMAELRRGGR